LSAFVGAERLTWLHHPVPPAALRWRLEEAREGCLVTPGFVKPHKGYDDLLGVVAENPDWRWILAGGPQDERDREYASTLLAEACRRGAEQRIQMTSYLAKEELERMAVSARIAVFPFRHATGSGSIAWAIAMGLPVVATDLPAIRPLVEAGAGIELVRDGCPERWSETLGRLLEDPRRLEDLALRNVKFAARESYAACASWFATVVRGLASRPPRSTGLR